MQRSTYRRKPSFSFLVGAVVGRLLIVSRPSSDRAINSRTYWTWCLLCEQTASYLHADLLDRLESKSLACRTCCHVVDRRFERVNSYVIRSLVFDPIRRGNAIWRAVCDCGNEFTIQYSNAISTKSCGCLKRARLTTHGQSSHPLYNCWAGMVDRCTNPLSKDFPSYGGRGISYDSTWSNCKRFFNDIENSIGNRPSADHSLDRINVNGGYFIDNLRWATRKEQMENRRILLTMQKDHLRFDDDEAFRAWAMARWGLKVAQP